MMLVAVGFAVALFFWTRLHFGIHTALLTTLFLAFSPTVLAHARLVTYDFGGACAFFVGICAYLRFLSRPTRSNVLLSGLAFGGAQLLRFSAALLGPLYILLLFSWLATLPDSSLRLRSAVELGLKTLMIGGAAILLVWTVYGCLVWGARYVPAGLPFQPVKAGRSFLKQELIDFYLALLAKPITRPVGEAFLGLHMEAVRATETNVSYFLGKTRAAGSHFYLPVLYLCKEALAFHFLTLLALLVGIRHVRRFLSPGGAHFSHRFRQAIHTNFVEFSALAFILVYWILAVRSPLNLGIRYALPTFPFIYLLVARQLSRASRLFGAITIGLAFWLVIGTVAACPDFLSYYNRLGGGMSGGWKIAVDSNYDWGQDLERLREYLSARHIRRISVDYFGTANPSYYLHDAYVPWDGTSKDAAHGWFAISATKRQFAFGADGRKLPPIAPNFQHVGSYDWLKRDRPLARAGESIFIYWLPQNH
jgi:hypothetical protein